ncbi:MAG: DUF1109 domain-containing protein [Paracoccaceae bacterium]
MKTDDLIRALAADSQPPRPFRAGLAAMALIAAVLGVSVVFLGMAGPRAGLMSALGQPMIAAKSALPLMLFLLALPVTVEMMRPERLPRLPRALILPIALAVVLWVTAFATLPEDLRFADVSRFALTECLGLIIGLSLPSLGLAFMVLRRGAPASPLLAGAMAGVTIGSGTAAGYSLFCTQDNPLFYVTWYGVAILAVTILAAIIGSRALRW